MKTLLGVTFHPLKIRREQWKHGLPIHTGLVRYMGRRTGVSLRVGTHCVAIYREPRQATTALEVQDTPKMLRETLCVAQTLVATTIGDRRQEHVARLERLVNACDAHRPLGPDGKHGSRHTDTCGCER